MVLMLPPMVLMLLLMVLMLPPMVLMLPPMVLILPVLWCRCCLHKQAHLWYANYSWLLMQRIPKLSKIYGNYSQYLTISKLAFALVFIASETDRNVNDNIFPNKSSRIYVSLSNNETWEISASQDIFPRCPRCVFEQGRFVQLVTFFCFVVVPSLLFSAASGIYFTR